MAGCYGNTSTAFYAAFGNIGVSQEIGKYFHACFETFTEIILLEIGIQHTSMSLFG